jgi:hypothetical protein
MSGNSKELHHFGKTFEVFSVVRGLGRLSDSACSTVLGSYGINPACLEAEEG